MAHIFKPILLSLLLLSSICFGQKKTDWQKSNLKGRVKSITTTVYDATEKFGEPVKDGIKEKSEIVTIQYDTKGKIITPSKGGNVVYKYDIKGNVTEETSYGSDNSTIISKSVFKYDANSNVIEEINYDAQGDVTEKKVNTYDANGNLIVNKKSGTIFNGTRNQGQALVTKYKYDTYGRPTKVSVGIGDDGELGSENYKYDTKGEVIEKIGETFNGVNLKKTYKYTYDANGNWITKVSFASSAYMNMKAESKADEITERLIEYHKDPAQLEKEYKALITKADSNFASKNYREAIDYYKQSLEIKNEQTIKNKISNAQKLEIVENYQNHISDADSAFNEKKYRIAFFEYQKALEIKDEQYPKDRLKESKEKIDAENSQKEAEEKRIADEKALKEKRIADEKALKEKIDVAIKKGNKYFEEKKYKAALYEYNAANSIEFSSDISFKIKNTQQEINRIDSLQNLRLEIYSYLKSRNESMILEIKSLKKSLEDKKEVYGKNYMLCMTELYSQFPSKTLFNSSNISELTKEDTWNYKDQEALDLLSKYKEEFTKFENFHNSVKMAFETENKVKLKLLKSSDDPKEIISKF